MYEVESRTLSETPTMVMRTKTGLDGIPAFLGTAYAEAARAVEHSTTRVAGPPFARYRLLGDPEVDGFEIEAGFAVMKAVEGTGDVSASTLPGGPAAVTMHIGPYQAMEPAYAAIKAWIDDAGATPDGPAWEIYYSDPVADPDPSTWRTEVVQPYRPADRGRRSV